MSFLPFKIFSSVQGFPRKPLHIHFYFLSSSYLPEDIAQVVVSILKYSNTLIEASAISLAAWSLLT